MILITSDNLIEATKQGFLKLYESAPNSSDASILREDSAVIEVLNPEAQAEAFELRDGKLYYVGDYFKYFPDMDRELPKVEQEHFTDIIIDTGHLDTITEHLQRYPDTRRGVISTWLPEYLLNPKKSGVCVAQLYFRMRDGKLEVHSHSRANDAYRLLLMDMQLSTWFQREVARRIGVPVGRYIHFVDSLQFYAKYREGIEKQRDYILSSPAWQ